MSSSNAIRSAGWSVAGRVSPPALWGKLPSHADFVTHGVKAGEVAALQHWLVNQVSSLPAASRRPAEQWMALKPERYKPSPYSIPVAFVVPPGVLPFSGQQHVLGVVANSCDKLGRQHPLIVYQRANARWLRQHFARLGDTANADADADADAHANDSAQTGLRQPWLFWLARLVSRYAGRPDALAWLDESEGASSPLALSAAVTVLWDLHAPGVSQWVGVAQRAPTANTLQGALDAAAKVLEYDAADDLRGVANAPWADWPDRLWCAPPAPAASSYWQQDSHGGYVGASQRLGELWGR